MAKTYNIFSYEQAQTLDFTVLQDKSIELCHWSIDGSKVIVEYLESHEHGIDNFLTHSEAVAIMHTEEWYSDIDIV